MFRIEKFDLLVSVYIFCIMVAELMGTKTFPLITIFGYPLNASVAILVLPLLFSINDVIVEVYGKDRAKSVVRSGLIIVFGVFLFSILATALPPSTRFQSTEAAYDAIFQSSARISAASLIAFAAAEFLDIFVFVKLRKALGKNKLWLRNNVSNFISQFIDTLVFMTLAFYAFDKPLASNWGFLASIIVPYWLLKCGMSVIETPLVYAGVRWLKKDR